MPGVNCSVLGCGPCRRSKRLKIFKLPAFSNSNSATITIKNKLSDALAKLVLLYACEVWGPELLSYRTHFDKSTIEQVHIKFCKQTLNIPNILGFHPRDFCLDDGCYPPCWCPNKRAH